LVANAWRLDADNSFAGEDAMNCKNFKMTAVLTAVAALAIGQTPDGKAPPPKYDPASVERGRQSFASTCGFCHGTSAKGGEKGPDLLRSVLVLDDENGKSIGPVILKGRQEKGMPRFPLVPGQITDIANFLHNSVLNAADRDSYKILNIVTGDANAGAAYFARNCTSCHSASGNLKGVASKYEPVTLQGKFLQPNQSWTEGTPPHTVSAISVTVTLPSGESFTGLPLNVDDFNVSLRDGDGNYRSFKRTKGGPRVEIHNRLQAHLDLLTTYSDEDIHNITAYLVTLK
jgi:cytochrome c oxidase cbb3-type subunit III